MDHQSHRSRRMSRRLARRAVLFPLFAFAFAAVGAIGLTQNATAASAQQDMGRMLVNGLKATDGCIGVETGSTDSGHQMIMAWFENKAAALRWYNSAAHQQVMGMVGGDQEYRKPMTHVPDDVAIMVIAAITPSDRPEIPDMPLPISQISIEMYTPLPGGAYFGGRVAPEGLNVPHMTNYGG
ncbi:MAG: hypothetical protein AAGB51_11155 [Planctomycetota bacterium]